MATREKIGEIVNLAMTQATGVSPGSLEGGGLGSQVFSWLVRAGDIIPPWWSRSRDYKLLEFYNNCNHLAIAVYNSTAKMVGIPFDIVPKDTSNFAHLEQAEELTQILKVASGFGRGWDYEYSRFVLDLLTQDNGAFMEIVGDGPADGPILGLPTGLVHRDSRRCTRTGNPVYPVIFQDVDGRLYKIHWTRIIMMSQMPSAQEEMYGVGLCAVSRSCMVAQNLLDISVYKMERLGSRPHNQIIVGKGITGQEIMTSLRRAEETMSNQGMRRYSHTIAIGSKNTEIGLDKIDLAHLDPFDEETSINLGMYAIAAAFGMDSDELWPGGGRSGSQGEANLKRMRSRGRLPAQLTSDLAQQFNFKVLPPHLTVEFDFRDDEEDQQKALIRDIRGRNRERDLGTGSVSTRTARLNMLEDRDISPNQYEDMELDDGRLPDGKPIALLFHTQDPIYERHLKFSQDPLLFHPENPADVLPHAQAMIREIETNRSALLDEWAMTTSKAKESRLNRAYHALDWLEDQYRALTGTSLPAVPMGSRRLRVDTRVQPEITEAPSHSTATTDENVPDGQIELSGTEAENTVASGQN